MLRAAVVASLLASLPAVAVAQTAPARVTVEYTVINRTSAKKDASGNFLPPFNRATIDIARQKEPFARGSPATVLPIAPALPPLTVPIADVKTLPDGDRCTGEKPLYEMTGAPITRPDVLEAQPLRVPSGVVTSIRSVLVYPATPKAQLVRHGGFTALDIPAGFADVNVVVGVDLTGNGRPEAVVVEYCPDPDGTPDLSRGRSCENRVQAVHLKGADGHWTAHRLYKPC